MTLVLTELSEAGIAMAADSAITKIRGGKIVEVDQRGWLKLLKVPRIRAAISYWGMIGAVTPIQFDIWLQRVIDSGNYNDLNSFADHLVASLNSQCRNKPLPEKHDVGIHVAGYENWSDGKRRPVFFHVHNGHGCMIYHREFDQNTLLLKTLRPEWLSEPRKLFEKHQDFPFVNKPLEISLEALRGGYITRNGDYSLYALIWQKLAESIYLINLIPNTSLPRNPNNISSRKGYLHTILETIVRLYRCSNLSPTIGGVVSSLGINEVRYHN
ncbi:hypothetical protein EKD04_017480 [Chloroflexales bacterium ZM16-3]|nr:hypothetical protein [Chloroflexales bacterium ZM16-3]